MSSWRPDRATLSRMPALVAASLRLVWQAGRRQLLTAVVLQLLGGAAVTVQLLLIQSLLAGLFAASRSGSRLSSLLPVLIALVAVTAASGFAGAVLGEQQRLLGELARHYAEARLLEVTGAAELAAFDSPEFHNRLLRARQGAFLRPFQLATGLLGLLSSLFGLIGIAVALLAIQPILISLTLLAAVPILFAATRGSRAFYMFSWRGTPNDRRRAYLFDLLSSRNLAKEVRAYGLASFLGAQHQAAAGTRIRELRRLVRNRLTVSLAATAATSCLLGSALLLLGYLAVRGQLSLSGAGAAAAGVLLLSQRLQGLTFAAAALYEAALFVEDFTSFVESPPPATAGGRRPGPGGFRRLTVEAVSFAYPEAARPALEEVSLEIGAGEVVALIGENGSGKTTLAKLLCGLYRPQAGHVRWDGADLRELDPEELRSQIAVVFQDFAHYAFSARENIGLGRHERIGDSDGIEAAARLANANHFLTSLERGYETPLGREFEGGQELSAGQWQAVALARAFFRDAPFLILDEPSAALDARAEHALFERIRELLQGRSALLISHRFSNVRLADRIYVLKSGRVVEHGTHDQLMAQLGIYADLFKLQAAAYLKQEPADGL